MGSGQLRWHRRVCADGVGIVPCRKEADAILAGDDLEDLIVIQAGEDNTTRPGREADAADIGRGEVGHPGAERVEELAGPAEAEVWVPGTGLAADEAGELEGAEGLGVLEDAAGGAEADEELGDAEEEALEVELEEFPALLVEPGIRDRGSGRERATHFSNLRSSAALWGRSAREVLSSTKVSVSPVNVPFTQSTSPPRTRRVSASLVFTTAHHCTAVSTSPPQVGLRSGEGFSEEVDQASKA